MFNNSTPFTMPVMPASGGYGSGGGMGGWGDSWWVVIILFALIFGWGNNGWGGNGNGGSSNGFVPYAVGSSYTDSAIQRGFDNQSVMNKLNGLENGLCDGFYAVNTSLLQGFNGVDYAICNLGYQVQNGFNQTNVALMQGQHALSTQLANCCCENREAIANVRYDMATQACDTRNTIQNSTRDIIDNQNANSRAILDFLTQDKIATLTAENQSLKFQASQTAQNAFITANQEAQTAELIRRLGADCPVNAYVVQPPTPVSFPTNCCGQFSGFNGYGYNNGCGCGCA